MSGIAEAPAGPASLLIVATVDNFLRDFLLPFARHYRKLGWRVDALAARDETYEECAAAFDRVWDIDWTRDPKRLSGLPSQLRRVRQIVAQQGYDLVHVHTPIAALITRLALRRSHRPGATRVIYTAHGFHFFCDRLTPVGAGFLAVEKLAARWTDELVVINDADRQAAERWRLGPTNRIHLMPGIGIETERYRTQLVTSADLVRLRSELELGRDDALFLMIAEFTANKRHADAIRALSRLGRPDVHLAIAGREGPALPAVRQLTEQCGLGGRVHILGFREDIPALVRASIATVLVSGREGLPRSVMESLSLETPVIGTNIRGVSDLVGQAGGLLVKVGDVDGISQAMAWMLDHPEQARSFGQNGSALMAKYDLRHVMELHDELYAKVLKRGPERRQRRARQDLVP